MPEKRQQAPHEEDENGKWLCHVGCGRFFAPKSIRKHELKCDGIERQEDGEGNLLCQKGCGSYFCHSNIHSHERICIANQHEKDENGKLLCRVGCGQFSTPEWALRHELVCDGIERQQDDEGRLLCQKGCGCYFRPSAIRPHEASCFGRIPDAEGSSASGLFRCSKCGLLFPKRCLLQHENPCDGIKREKDDKGHLLCHVGCGVFILPQKLKAHEENCTGRPRQKHPTLDLVKCLVGCELFYAPGSEIHSHEMYCDGIEREIDENGRIFCSKGCGLHSQDMRGIKNHENQTCKANYAPTNTNPTLEYVSYLEFCSKNGLNQHGQPGKLPVCLQEKIMPGTFNPMDEIFSIYDLKADEDIEDMIQLFSQLDVEDAEDNATSTEERSESLRVSNGLRLKEANYGDLCKATRTPKKAELCQGASWAHGLIPCGVVKDLYNTNVVLQETVKGKVAKLHTCCSKCESKRQKIQRWVWQSKYTDGGIKLCSLTKNCQEECDGDRDCCKVHKLRALSMSLCHHRQNY
jgi:hypothetical protein